MCLRVHLVHHQRGCVRAARQLFRATAPLPPLPLTRPCRAVAAPPHTASDKCQHEKRKTINGDDLLWAMSTLGFDKYVEPLKLYLAKYREVRQRQSSVRGARVVPAHIRTVVGVPQGAGRGGSRAPTRARCARSWQAKNAKERSEKRTVKDLAALGAGGSLDVYNPTAVRHRASCVARAGRVVARRVWPLRSGARVLVLTGRRTCHCADLHTRWEPVTVT